LTEFNIILTQNLIITNNKKVWINGGHTLFDQSPSFNRIKPTVISITPTDDDNFLFATTQGLVLYNTKKIQLLKLIYRNQAILTA
jgi:hypothetical protein